MFFEIAKFAMDVSGLSTQQKVAEWANANKVNPFDMGAKNYQRCLWDLKLGGRYSLIFEDSIFVVFEFV
ncbi:MAG: hypothetical protein AAGK10_22240, partial [Cyanobacteria bacterium J06555_3]